MKIYEEMNSKKSVMLAGVRSSERKKKRVIKYNEKPVLCKFCKKALSYEKRQNNFCNHSCSASMNNKGIKRNLKEGKSSKKLCLNCQQITVNQKFCSRLCNSSYNKKERKNKIIEQNFLINYQHNQWFLIETRGHKCEKCKQEIWMEKPIPLDTHHKDGNSDNNYLFNLKLLCPNCHRQTSNYGSKNRGNCELSKRYQYKTKQLDNEFDKSYLSNKKIKIKDLYDKCPVCEERKWIKHKYCSRKCVIQSRRKNNWNKADLKKLIDQNLSYMEIGKILGVSDTTVKKWAKRFDLI